MTNIGMGNLRIDRRGLLLGLGVGLAAPALLRGARALAAPGSDPFTLGVASGDPWPDGFVIWTRIAPDPLAEDGRGGAGGPVEVRWEVAADPQMRRVLRAGEAVADERMGHAVHVELNGLQPGRPYWYRFTALGVQSEIGRAATAPAPGEAIARLQIGVASCSHWERGYFKAYGHMAEEQHDLTLFLGDYIYEYSLGPDRKEEIVRPYGMAEATTLGDYRRRYALHKTDANLQALHASAPCIATWDDHEVQDDYSGIWSSHPEVAERDFAVRRKAAYRAFVEHMPLRLRLAMRGDDVSIYRRMRFGRLADIFVLDGRQYRSEQPCVQGLPTRKGRIAPESCAELDDPARTFLGFDQERWLYDGLRDAPARWNVLAQGLKMAPMRFKAGEEYSEWTDTWDGFAAGRERLLAALQGARVANPVVLSGDYHSFWANDLREKPFDPDSPVVATEFVGTSITSSGPSYEGISRALPENPQVRFFDSRQRGYMMLDVRPELIETKFQMISDRRDPNAVLSTLRTFNVEAGRPGVVEA